MKSARTRRGIKSPKPGAELSGTIGVDVITSTETAAPAAYPEVMMPSDDPDDLGINPYGPVQHVEPEVLSAEEHEQIVLAQVLAGRAPAAAAQVAGLEPRAGAQIMQRPQVRSALLEALERSGVNDLLLTRVINSGLRARRPITHEGRITAVVPDHAARHKYLGTLLELRGDLERSSVDEDSWEAVILRVRSRRAGAC